jgi:diguanylate cyclase (GGDEF)-like protein/PAS domain S-box-containing protein
MGKEPTDQSRLRVAAEAQLALSPLKNSFQGSGEEFLHELQVHQIELEMQNEELQRIQIALEESRDRYVDLYEFSPVGYLTLSHHGTIAEVNLSGANMLGLERKKILARRFSHFIAPEEGERWFLHFSKILKDPTPQSCELLMRRSDNTLFAARLDCLPIQNGGVSSVRIALSDISDRKQAERELRIAAITFETQDGIMVTDSNAVILRVNHAFTRLTGYSADEAVGKTPALLKSGRQNKAFYQRMWLELKRKGHWQGEIWNRRKNGKIYAEWLSISAVMTPEGEIMNFVGSFSDITENKEAEAEIHRLAYYDSLTGLPNRRLLHDRLGQAMAGSRRTKHCGTLLFLDLDNFKTLNDTRGHDTGDKLLFEVSQRILTCVREDDTVARLGGDEFVVILENLSPAKTEAAVQTRLVAEKIRAALAHPYDLDGHNAYCPASIGIALFPDDQSDTVETLLKHADMAMYKAKRSGGNALGFYDPQMQTALDLRSGMEEDLRLALQRSEFQLYYQAQIDSLRHVTGAEALLRWNHPTRGMVPPDDFIELAEETGLILPIGHWVLQAACHQIKDWSTSTTTRDLSLAVNVSARQLRQADFVAEVEKILEETGANPSRVKIEVTESMVIHNVSDTIDKMRQLKERGIVFSMDDFGTGYSSLAYLNLLPLDQLKIDRSFIDRITRDSNSAAIAQTIITMGNIMGIQVIAEGVETQEQLDQLHLYGCSAYQGYLFSKPVPLGDFEALLK